MSGKVICLVVAFSVVGLTSAVSAEVIQVSDTQNWNTFADGGFGDGDTLQILSGGTLTLNSRSRLVNNMELIVEDGGVFTINTRMDMDSGAIITMNGGQANINGDFKFPDSNLGGVYIYLNGGLLVVDNTESFASRGGVLYVGGGRMRTGHVSAVRRDPEGIEWNIQLLPGYGKLHIDDIGGDFKEIWAESMLNVEFDLTASGNLEAVSPAVINVVLSQAREEAVTVDYAVTGGTAVNGEDYSLADGTLSFGPGQTSKSISIVIFDNGLDEQDETIEITLSNVQGGGMRLGVNAQHVYTIIDPRPGVAFDSAESEGGEDVSPAYVAVSLSSPSDETIMADYGVTGGTATGGGMDYSLPAGTLQFEPGEVTKYIIVTILEDELEEYPNETVEISLSNPVNTKLGAVKHHTFTILPPALRLCPIGDLNNDCQVNFEDLRLFVDQWLNPGGSCSAPDCADLDKAGVVDMLDFALLAENWLEKAYPLVINELMASNSSTIEDPNEAGAFPDWIELYNAGTVSSDLGGMYLTDDLDDPTRWWIPDGVTIKAGRYLLFWADGHVNQGPTHTNFELLATGEQVGLFDRDGVTLIDSISFGRQETDFSYGYFPDASGNRRVFAIPTPWAENDGTYAGVVENPTFSHEHGFYETSFEVAIICGTPNAVIHYTTNGSDPTESHGTVYSGPIMIEGTTCLRAMAFKSGWIPTKSHTRTYIFLDDVLTQSKPAGFNDEIDWDMDPDVVNDPCYSGDTMKNALKAIPTLSIVMAYDDVFGSTNGIFLNGRQCGGNRAYEHAASLELIYPDGRQGLQINCAAQPHGAIRRGKKHSMDLQFKGMYGPTKLRYPIFESAPIHADGATDVFNRFVLRAGLGTSWATNGSDKVTYARDQWSRDAQIDMSGIGSRGAFFHVYLNGLYFGLYNAAEEANHDFTSAYLGGEGEDWFAVKASIERNCPGYIINGDRARFDEMVARAEAKDLEDANKYEEFRSFLDIDRYIDYLMIIWYNGCGDMYDNNWFGGMRMYPPGSFMWFTWDTEASWGFGSGSWPPGSPTGRAWFPTNFIQSWQDAHSGDVAVNNRIVKMWNALRENQDFRIQFADRVYKHCFNDGPLTDENSQARWHTINDYIRDAVIAESARWGDGSSSTPRTRDDHWEPAVEYVANLMEGNVAVFIAALRDHGFYPSIDPPEFQHGGQVDPGYELTMSSPHTIYYTTDGTDPREAVTGNPVGTEYSGPITLNESTVVKARARSGEWSALHEATFAVGPVAENLRITEIMYHPGDPEPASPYEDDDFEFVELRNINPANSINLALVSFTNGIDFTFPSLELAPGESVVVVKDLDAFESRYGTGINIASTYAGSLNNAGERVELEDAIGQTILNFRYEDGWYDITDGDGFSLTIKDPAYADPNAWDQKSAWRPSAAIGGSPGWDDAGTVPELGDVVINELLAHSHLGAPDWIELHNTTDNTINIGGWFLSDSDNNLTKYEISDGESIPANGYIVFYEDQHFGNLSDLGCHTPFALSENGETLYLHSGQDGVLTGYSDEEKFGASETNVAFGRYLKSTGTYNFVAMSENTPGWTNAYPKVGPVVISEIMYHPQGSRDAEYVELLNISGGPVTLYDFTTNEPWRFADEGGIEFFFPTVSPVTMADGEYILLVKDVGVFSSKFTAEEGTRMFEWGLAAGNLSNGGEKIQLSKPGDVDGMGVRQYIRVDRVNYSDGSHPPGSDPWPTEPDTDDKSLTRKVMADYGNDVINWQAADPSPGSSTP